MNWPTEKRFRKFGKLQSGMGYRRIQGDNEAFDPTPWLEFQRVAMFGSNCFSNRLPKGTLLIWVKKRVFGGFLGDAEVCWLNKGHAVYLKHHGWNGGYMEGEPRRPRFHPTEKPVAIMGWVLDRLGLREGATVLDPYCGSGSTGLACVERGINFLGIEKDPAYARVARQRLKTLALAS